MRERASGLIHVGVVLLLCLAAVPVDGMSGADERSNARMFGFQNVDPDSVLLRVEVRADGSAAWEIEYRIRLDDENTTAAFETLQEDIRTNATRYRERFARRIADVIASAENATGRDMARRNVSVRADISHLSRAYGVVVYRFEWIGFAAVNRERIEMGDALAGFFLDGETRLLVSWPEGYEANVVRPTPDEHRARVVIWTGPTEFTDGEPSVVLVRSSEGVENAGSADLIILLVASALVALSTVAGVWWTRLRGGGPAVGQDTSDSEPALTNGEINDLPEELLSNEERILRLIERRGGRIKQREVVEALSWTEARTSQVVGGLREEGAIETFRIGRENVLSLPENSDL